jgi:hypothetical protein
LRRCTADGTWDRVLDEDVLKDDGVGNVGGCCALTTTQPASATRGSRYEWVEASPSTVKASGVRGAG